MLDCWPIFVPVTPVLATTEESVLTGTGISVPEAIIAFLLLLVNTIGREITLKFPVELSRWTIAASVLPAATYTFVPVPICWIIWPKLTNPVGPVTPPVFVVGGEAAGSSAPVGSGAPVLRVVCTYLFLYFRKIALPISSSLWSVSSPRRE